MDNLCLNSPCLFGRQPTRKVLESSSGVCQPWRMKFLLSLLLATGCLAEERVQKNFGNFSYLLEKGGKTAVITGYQGEGGSVVVPEKIDGAKVTKIEEKAFSNSANLTGILLPETVTEIGPYAFAGCYYLTLAVLPQGLVSLGEGAFKQCRSLVQINFPGQLTNIASESFSGCSSLEKVEIPARVKTIGRDAFSGSATLRMVQISSSVENIGDHAFAGCTELSEVILLSRKTSLGNYVFSGCPALNVIRLPSDKPGIFLPTGADGEGLSGGKVPTPPPAASPAESGMSRRRSVIQKLPDETRQTLPESLNP